jgi:hypothetical protein
MTGVPEMSPQIDNPKRFTGETPDNPERAEPDWNEIEDVEVVEDQAVNEEDLDDEIDEDVIEEDDDNPYQESDEALPDDAEERVISRNPDKEEGRFDEV